MTRAYCFRRRFPVFPLLVFSTLIFTLIPTEPASAEARIDSFTPLGMVKGVRQATIRFSEPMVALGDPRLADPVEVICGEKGKGRWIDGKNWSYDFDGDLPAGVVCEFRLKSGVRTLSGQEVSGRKVFQFTTGGPSIIRARPWEGEERIDERQIFVLFLDAAPTGESLLRHVYFTCDGIMEKIGVRIVTGKERAAILKSIHEKSVESIVLIQAKQAFPESAAVSLVWGKGVSAKSGVTTDADQILPFKVRSPFKAEFTCAREKPNAGCIPVLPMQVRFSASISKAMASRVVLRGKGGKVWKHLEKSEDEDDGDGVSNRVVFPGPFPEKTVFTVEMPPGLKDDAGRSLSNSKKFPLRIQTDPYPPLAKFSSRFGIMELKGDLLLPVTVRNIEAEIVNRVEKVQGLQAGAGVTAANGGDGGKGKPQKTREQNTKITRQLQGRIQQVSMDQEVQVVQWMQRIAGAEQDKSLFGNGTGGKNFNIPKPGGEKAFEVIGIPLSGAGFFVMELESRILGTHLLGKPAPMYVPTAALVTNMATHFKWGRESSLVWVTALDSGNPVGNAEVSIRNCKGERLWKGRTDARGVALIRQRLPSGQELTQCKTKINYSEASHILSGIGSGMFIFARIPGDMSFTHSSWDDGIEPWRFQLPEAYGNAENRAIAHTIFDRSLFRAGETVHMKHVLRNHTTRGFDHVPAGMQTGEILIAHRGSGQEYRTAAVWGPRGAALSEWKIPETAKLGTYDVSLGKMPSGSFRVEEYRVPLMRAIIQGPTMPLVKARSLDVDIAVSYLSGGGASLLPVRLRAEVQEKSVSFPDYEDYTFTSNHLKEGIVNQSDREGAESAEVEGAQEEDRDVVPAGRNVRLKTMDLKLDETGALRTRIDGIPEMDAAKELHLEAEFRDPNGEVQTSVARIPIHPANRFVGICPESWTLSKDALKYKVVVLDLKGKPVPNADVTVDLYQEIVRSHRIRLVGGFYAYQNTREIRKLGRHFTGKTDKRGVLSCEGASPVSGSVVVHAEVKDEAGNVAVADSGMWVAGKDDWWFEGRSDDRIDVLPEKKHYEPGETARFQVRMPFREATALVTVEREGIIDVFIRKLSGKSPVVDVPIKNYYAPNVYVSVLCVRGRAGQTKATATFDPGRPAYRIGIGEIRVGWKAHELKVNVVPDKEVYKIREEMNVRLSATKAIDGKPARKAEVAVAAVDEGLLQLMPNNSWKLLNAMMNRRNYEVRTATAQSMVIGKRHFGLKALPHGGGGGRQITRELFDTLLLWRGRVTLDEKGEASVKIPLNDSLTAFRIVAIATGETDRFGTGEASVRTSQDLMILSGLPRLVREGDRFRAGFTVRNASEKDLDVDVRLNVGSIRGKTDMGPVSEKIRPGEAKEVYWTIDVPSDVDRLDYEIVAREKAGDAHDRMKVTQKVVPAVPVRTLQATLAQIRGAINVEVERPSDAMPGRGGVAVQVRPKIGDGLAGVREYMERYPYVCLEQKVSKAVALRSTDKWRDVARQMPSYLDGDGLLKYFPSEMCTGSDVLTSYVLSIAHEAGYELPASVRERTVNALRQFVNGRIIRHGSLPTADLAIRKVAAIEALSRYEEVDGQLLASIPVEPNLWPTSAVIDWMQLMGRIKEYPDKERKKEEAQQIIRSRLNFQGTHMGFSTDRMDNLWWLMTSPDNNAVRSILALVSDSRWQEDIPRMVRGALGRMHGGHWETTTANGWGTLAMEAFSKKFESAAVTGTTEAVLGEKKKSIHFGKTSAGDTVEFEWPRGKKTLALRQTGSGYPWATVQSLAAVPLKAPLSSGYTVKKTLTPVEQKTRGRWSRGDVVRVRLDLESQSDMTWVVVSDPIPAGGGIIRSDLGGGSTMLTAKEKREGGVWEAFTEKSDEALRTYYEYVPKGKWSVEYTLRLNNEGRFVMPATRVEALYAPEMFGELPNRAVDVKP